MSERFVITSGPPHRPHVSWPSLVFKIPRPAWRLRVDQLVGCPLAVVNARRYWRVRWAGLGVDAWPNVAFEVENRSGVVVHSYHLRVVARLGSWSSGAGVQPEGGLQSARRSSEIIQEPDFGAVAVAVDFVQFYGGGTWYSTDDGAFVTEAGVRAGARAATTYLLQALKRHDSATIMAALPRLHADVPGSIVDAAHGYNGFYCGVTNLAVRLQHECDKEDPTKDLHSWLERQVT
jgi:hypothetical protein